MSESKLTNDLIERSKIKQSIKDHFSSGKASKHIKEAIVNLGLLISDNQEAMEALNLVHEAINATNS